MKKMPQIKPSKANRPRNAFDLSQKHLFTAPAGALLPILSLDLNFHDHVEIQASDFMRTLPMNTAAFISMRSVYEFFYIPYSQIWHEFDQFITGMTDFRSRLLSDSHSSKAPSMVPCVDRYTLFSEALKLSGKDLHGYPTKDNALRLLDLLGYGALRRFGDSKDYVGGFTGKVSLFRIAAYNKVYNDFYRNTTYESYNVSSFNLDGMKGALSDADVNAKFFERYLSLYYRNAPLDYLTNLLPKPLFDMDSSLIPALQTSIGRGVTFDVNKEETSAIASVRSAGGGVSTLDVSSIRSAFALDKLLSVSMRAGKTYAEQIEAHFGVSVSEGRDGQVYYLGGFDSDVQVGDVTQTSGTTDPAVSDVSKSKLAGYLGKVTGKGVGSGNGRITFDAKEPGILMCIYSLVPAMQYDNSRLDPFVAKLQRGDFFIPEFENLGMQPLSSPFITTSFSLFNSDKTPVLLGWQPRYSEYKTALDVNHGQFMYDHPLGFWTISKGRTFYGWDKKNSQFSFDISQLKISPRWLDSVFAVNYNGTELTDCMFGYAHFKIQKVSDMSEDGLPRV